MEKKISKEIGKRKIVFLSLRGVVYGYVYYISLSQCGIDAVTIESLESLIPMIQKVSIR